MVNWNGRTSERWKCEPHQVIIFLQRNLGNFVMSGLSSTKLDLKLSKNDCIVITSDSKPGKDYLMEVQKVQGMMPPSLERFQPDTPNHVTGVCTQWSKDNAWLAFKCSEVSVFWQMSTEAHLLFLISKHILLIAKYFSIKLENLLPLTRASRMDLRFIDIVSSFLWVAHF